MSNIKYVVNVEKQEIQEIEMTDAELKAEAKERKILQDLEITKHAEAEAKETQRQAILDRLGLTADEAKLILG